MSRPRAALLYALAWAPVVAIYAGAIAAQGGAVVGSVRAAVFTLIPAAAAGAFVLRAARRWAGDPRPGRLFARHAVAAAAYAFAWTGFTVAQLRAFAPSGALAYFLKVAVVWQAVSGLFLYAAIAGIGHGAEVSRRLREREAAAARAELHALRAQLDPHFLFNTLHSLTALARRDPAAVELGLERFGGLLRHVLDANRREAAAGAHGDVPLGDELAFVRDYLALERMRLGDRLRVAEDVDDEALECALPALTLQPLVENAVRHGLAPRAAGGTVRVAARVDERDRLVLEVGDDGAGCEAAAVDGSDGVGVAVVRRRLRARYGEAGCVDVVTAPGQGFTARVVIPARSAAPRVSAGAWPAVHPAATTAAVLAGPNASKAS